MKKNTFTLTLAVVGLVLGGSAHAARRDTSGHDMRLMPVGSGVSSPSTWSSLEQNPAGLTFNNRSRLQLDARTSDTDFDDITDGLSFLTGNGMVGMGVGYLGTYDRNASNYGFGVSAGLAAQIPVIRTSLGVRAYKSIYAAEDFVDAGDGWNTGVGLLITPMPWLRIGYELPNLIGGLHEMGFGASFDVSNFATVTVDGAYNLDNDAFELHPALSVYVYVLQLTVGYAFDVTDNTTAMIRDGLDFGVAFHVKNRLAFQVMYNNMDKLYAGMNFAF